MKKQKVLIIDDDPIVHYITKFYYEQAEVDCELIFIEFAEEALQQLKNKEIEPEVILLDINMNGMNGWEFLDEFQNLPTTGYSYSSNIYMLSSSIYDSDKEKAASYTSVRQFIEKPLTIEKIKDMHHQMA